MRTCVTTIRKKLNFRATKALKIERGMDTELNYASCKCVQMERRLKIDDAIAVRYIRG